MENHNRLTLTGRLVNDPELKVTKNGTSVCRFSIANNIYIGQDHVNFFEVTYLGKLAEVANSYLVKGSHILIEGKLKQERWEKEGVKNSKVTINGEKIYFLDSKKSGAKADSDFVDELAF